MQEKTVNIYVAAFLLFLTALLQTQFLPAFLSDINQFVPDLTLLLVISWSLILPWKKSLWLAFASGLVLDLLRLSVYPFGLDALLFSFVAFGLSFVATSNRFHSTLIQAVPLSVVAALAYRLLLLLALRILGYNVLQFQILTTVVIPVSILDGALMIIFYPIVRGFSRVKER